NRLYFSDPRYGNRKGMEITDEQGRTLEGVYRLDPDSKVTRIIGREVERANGVLVSPDDGYLYVADNNNDMRGGARKLWRFALRPEGNRWPGKKKASFARGERAAAGPVKNGTRGAASAGPGNKKTKPRHSNLPKT